MEILVWRKWMYPAWHERKAPSQMKYNFAVFPLNCDWQLLQGSFSPMRKSSWWNQNQDMTINLALKQRRRKRQNGCSFFVWEKGHLKISSVSKLGADSSPQGGIPPSALLLWISRASEKLEEHVAGEELEKQEATWWCLRDDAISSSRDQKGTNFPLKHGFCDWYHQHATRNHYQEEDCPKLGKPGWW